MAPEDPCLARKWAAADDGRDRVTPRSRAADANCATVRHVLGARSRLEPRAPEAIGELRLCYREAGADRTGPSANSSASSSALSANKSAPLGVTRLAERWASSAAPRLPLALLRAWAEPATPAASAIRRNSSPPWARGCLNPDHSANKAARHLAVSDSERAGGFDR